MVNKALMARVEALEAAVGPLAFRVVLEYDDPRETPAAAVLRAPGPGLYAVMSKSCTGATLLCEIADDGRTTMHAPDGQETSW